MKNKYYYDFKRNLNCEENCFCEKNKDRAKSKDLWLIWDHPDQVNKIGEVSTNNKLS